jgi:sulfite exporter TauE/SafE
MNVELLLSVAAASLVGSVHCAAMCGGFAAMSGVGASSRRGRVATQAAYNGGRLVSYITLGTLAGALGRAVDLAGAAAGIGRVAATVAGSLLMLWGLVALLETLGVRVFSARFVLPRRLTAWLGALQARPPLWRALALGLATTLLPCGWLYAFALSAAGTASPLNGALVMAAFWLGNVPMLAGVGVLFGSFFMTARRHVRLLSAVTVLCVGLFTVVTRAQLPQFALPLADAPAAGAALPRAGACACHRGHKP